MSTQLEKALRRLEVARFHHCGISVCSSTSPNVPAEHGKRGKYFATAGSVFGYGDSPESAIAAAVNSAIELNNR